MSASSSINRPAHGFSIVEMLIVIALIAVVAGLAAMNVESLFRGLGVRPLPDVFKKAVREARFLSAERKDTVFLVFDDDESVFVIRGSNGEELGRFETGYEPRSREIDVTFYHLLNGVGSNADVFARRRERNEIERIRFNPDRSSTPFEVELKYGDARSEHRYDPFSDVEIKREE